MIKWIWIFFVLVVAEEIILNENGIIHTCELDIYPKSKLKCSFENKQTKKLKSRKGWKQICTSYCLKHQPCDGFQLIGNNKCKFFSCGSVLEVKKHKSNIGVIINRETKCIEGESTKSPTQLLI